MCPSYCSPRSARRADAVTSYVNETDDVGATALHYAVGGKCADIAALLLEHGARVDQPTKRGQTALMGAAQQMSVDLVDLLLVHGADVNRHDENLVDALSTVAFHFGNAVEELVERGARAHGGRSVRGAGEDEGPVRPARQQLLRGDGAPAQGGRRPESRPQPL